MDELLEFDLPPKRVAGKTFTAMRDARAILFKKDVLGFMISSFLALFLVFFGWLFVFSAAAAFIDYCAGFLLPVAAFVVDIIFLCLYWGAFFFGVMPVLLGRLRLVGLVAADRSPMLHEIFYYFTSPQRYRRALLIGALLALGIALPVALSVAAFYLSTLVYYDFLIFELSWWIATLIFIGLLVASFVCSLLFFFVCGGYLCAVGVAIGNEGLLVREALALSCGAGYRSLWQSFLFLLCSLWRLLLSLLTLGVLYVFYYSHHITLSYMRLCMALCPKGDTQ